MLVQDVAIAYGYNNITRTLPKSHTQGKQQPVNHLSDLIRAEVTLSPVGMHFYLSIETNLSCPVLASISVVLRLLDLFLTGSGLKSIFAGSYGRFYRGGHLDIGFS